MKMNAGIWIGVICGTIGMGVAITSVLVTTGKEGIYIAAGLLVMAAGIGFLLYKLLFAPMMLANRLRKTGIAGKALIKEVKDTGVTINNSPQVKLVLELKNSLGQRYTTTIRTLISRLQPNLYQPGMTIPVLVDPNDENKMVIDFERKVDNNNRSSLNSAEEARLKEELMKLQQQHESINLSGKSARAIVKKYTWLGVYINGNNPYAELEIEVMPDDAPAFGATVKGAIKEESVSKYQPGEEIFVKYDRYDLKKVTIDHS